MALAGISTLGIKLFYGVETTAGTKPSTFTQLTRINSIGGLTIDVEQIDASALEDEVTKYVAGRGDTGGSLSVTVNLTDATETEWETLISAYEGLSGNKEMWFEVYSPKLTKAFFVKAQPPKAIPLPESDQNGLWTVEIVLTVSDYVGLDTAVIPTSSGAGVG